MAKNTGVTPELWINRIKQSEAVQKDYDNRYEYTNALKEYRGEFKETIGAFIGDTPIIPINEVKAFIRTFLPAVYSRDPIITVNPRGKGSVGSSKIAEKAVNSLWRELHIKKEIRRCIVDACLGPWGWIKVGYTADIGEEEIDDQKLEVNQFIQSEEIYAVREAWKNIIYDSNAINPPYDCRWMAHRLVKPLEAIKANKNYKNTDKLQPSFQGQAYKVGKKRYEFDDIPYVELYEIWDMDSRKVFVVAEGADKYLREDEWPYKMTGFPFIGLTFDVNPDENYPQNFVGAWRPQLWEKIKLRSMALDHLKRFGRQLIIEEGSMSLEDEDKFSKGRTGSLIKVKRGTKLPPTPISYPPIQTDLYAISRDVEFDKDNISGQSNVSRGGTARTQTRTLGEIDRMLSSGELRNNDPVDIIEDFSEEIAYKLVALMKEFINLDKFVRVTATEAAEIITALGEDRFDGTGFSYTKDDIQGAYDIDIQAGSSLPLNKRNRLSLLQEVLKLGPSLGIAPNGLVSMTIGKNVLSDLEMYEVEQAYEVEMAELRAQQQAEAQIAEVTADAVKNGVSLTPPVEQKGMGRPNTSGRAPGPARSPAGSRGMAR